MKKEVQVQSLALQTSKVIFSVSSFTLKGDSGPLMNCSIIYTETLPLVCLAMLTAKVAVCL